MLHPSLCSSIAVLSNAIIAKQMCEHVHGLKRSEQPVGMGMNDTLCSAGCGETAALKPEGLPKHLPPLAEVPVVCVPHPSATFYSRDNNPAMAFKEVT